MHLRGLSPTLNLFKETSPESTIERVEGVLSQLGISLKLIEEIRFTDSCYSVRVEDSKISGLGTNGKGVTLKYAMASAYAEFLERLQNGVLYNDTFGIMPEKIGYFNDSVEVDIEEFKNQYPRIVSSLTKNSLEDTTGFLQNRRIKTLKCPPFTRMKDHKQCNLPYEWIRYVVCTNGMCAGNTEDEAIVQGLCEVMERFSLTQLFFENVSFPTIPNSEIRSTLSRKIMNEFEDKGLKVTVLDCSLDGKFPVVGILLQNSSNNKYRFCLGSHPIFDIALSRCLTEVVQGVSQNGLADTMMEKDICDGDRLTNFYRFRIDSTAKIPIQALINESKPKHRDVFIHKITDNREFRNYLTGLIHKNGYDIYIRDVSFLDFPSYHIYVPGMSEIGLQTGKQKLLFNNELNLINEATLTLTELPEDKKKHYTEITEELFNSPSIKSYFSRISDLVNINVKDESDFRQLDIDLYLSLLFYQLGNYKKTILHLERFIERHIVSENREYLLCVLNYFHAKADGVIGDKIPQKLHEKFDRDLVGEVVRDLDNPAEAFKYYKLPHCGDCKPCPISHDCFYEDWKKVASKLSEKIRHHSSLSCQIV